MWSLHLCECNLVLGILLHHGSKFNVPTEIGEARCLHVHWGYLWNSENSRMCWECKSFLHLSGGCWLSLWTVQFRNHWLYSEGFRAHLLFSESRLSYGDGTVILSSLTYTCLSLFSFAIPRLLTKVGQSKPFSCWGTTNCSVSCNFLINTLHLLTEQGRDLACPFSPTYLIRCQATNLLCSNYRAQVSWAAPGRDQHWLYIAQATAVNFSISRSPLCCPSCGLRRPLQV